MDFASSLASASNFTNNAGINFGGYQGGTTATSENTQTPTSTAARSLQGGVSAPIVDSPTSDMGQSGLSLTGTGNSQQNIILYVLLGIVAVVVIVLLKKRG